VLSENDHNGMGQLDAYTEGIKKIFEDGPPPHKVNSAIKTIKE